MIHWASLAIAIAAEVAGASFLRATNGFTQPLPSLIVVAGYGVALFFLSLTLDRIPTGIAYAAWSGVGVTLVAGIGWAVYGRALEAAALVGIGLIVAGVIVLNLFSQSAAH